MPTNKAFSSKLGKPLKQIHGAVYSFEVLFRFLPGVNMCADSCGSSYSVLLVPRVSGLSLGFLFKSFCTTLITVHCALPG